VESALHHAHCGRTAAAKERHIRARAQARTSTAVVAKTVLVPFDVSPFPYDGEVPEKNRRFLDVFDGERRGYSSARGGTYWKDET
jgi:hypothetical protein